MKQFPLLRLLLFLCCLGVFYGCHPAYSSPIKVFNSLPPGRMEHQSIEVAFNSGFPPGATLSVGYAPLDWTEIRIAGNSVMGEYGTASLELHVSPWPAIRQSHRLKLLNEIEFGLGGGVGGYCDEELEYCQQWPYTTTKERSLVGGWAGAGLGVGFDIEKRKGLVWDLEIDLYMRARFQYTDAKYAPATLWYTFGPGLSFRMQRFMRVYMAYAFAKYDNDIDTGGAMGVEIGLSFTFDLIPQKRTRIEQHW